MATRPSSSSITAAWRPTSQPFRFLGIRTVTNATDLTWRANRWLGLYGGYHFSNRLIRYAETFAVRHGAPRSLRAGEHA